MQSFWSVPIGKQPMSTTLTDDMGLVIKEIALNAGYKNDASVIVKAKANDAECVLANLTKDVPQFACDIAFPPSTKISFVAEGNAEVSLIGYIESTEPDDESEDEDIDDVDDLPEDEEEDEDEDEKEEEEEKKEGKKNEKKNEKKVVEKEKQDQKRKAENAKAPAAKKAKKEEKKEEKKPAQEKSAEQKGSFKCSQCSKTFKSEQGLKQHMGDKHKQ